MKKRPRFACWQCERTFTQVVDLEGEPVLRVECPYCGAEGKVDMAPYRRRIVTVSRGEKIDTSAADYALPDPVPTARPADDEPQGGH